MPLSAAKGSSPSLRHAELSLCAVIACGGLAKIARQQAIRHADDRRIATHLRRIGEKTRCPRCRPQALLPTASCALPSNLSAPLQVALSERKNSRGESVNYPWPGRQEVEASRCGTAGGTTHNAFGTQGNGSCHCIPMRDGLVGYAAVCNVSNVQMWLRHCAAVAHPMLSCCPRRLLCAAARGGVAAMASAAAGSAVAAADGNSRASRGFALLCFACFGRFACAGQHTADLAPLRAK